MIVIVNIPIIIEPGIFLNDKAEITRKPMQARSVSIFLKSPRANKVVSLLIIIPPLFKPINQINKPTPAPIAILRLKGMLEIIQLLNFVILIIKNRIPAKKTAPKAISHEYPISPTTV